MHTKGPWNIKRKSWPMTITGNIHQVTDDEGYPTAFVPAWDAPQIGEEDGTEEAAANARLIAAAPDLLEALETAKEVVDAAEGMTSCRSDDDFVWSAQKLINAAISKAKGEDK